LALHAKELLAEPRASATPKFNPLSLPCLSVDEAESIDIDGWDDSLEIEILDDTEYTLSMSTSSPADESCSIDYSFDLTSSHNSAASDESLNEMVQAAISSMDESYSKMRTMVPRSSSNPEEDCVSLCDSVSNVDLFGDNTDGDGFVYFDQEMGDIQEVADANDVILDRRVCTDHRSLLVSSKGFSSGIHEWTITVNAGDGQLQEIGVISNGEVDELDVESTNFGARAIYASQLSSETRECYYKSLNKDGSVRCQKPLPGKHWRCGDEIKVRLDADKATIRFFLNGNKVRKVMSLERERTYYPIIAHSGYCSYSVKSTSK